MLSILCALAAGLALPAYVHAAGGFTMPRAAEVEVRPPQSEPLPPLQPVPQVQVPESAPSRAPVGAENVRFILRGLDIEEVTAYPMDLIEGTYRKRIGTEVSLKEIYDIANEIQRRYRKDGYFLARAIVPAQTATEGRLVIHVFEGVISEVVVEGDIGAVQKLVKEYLRPLTLARPLKLSTMERCLLLANDIPGVVVKGILRPAPHQIGAAQLVATVERKVLGASALVDNLGSSYSGEWEIGATASLNSMTSLGDGWTLGGIWSDPTAGFNKNERIAQMSGSIRPWSNGIYIKFLTTYGQSNPGGSIASFDTINTKFLLSGAVGYAIIRSRQMNLFVEGGFDLLNSDTDIFTNQPFSKDKLRVLRLTAYGDYQDSWRGSNFMSLGLRQGLPILDASQSGDPLLSNPDASGTFTTLNGKISRLQPVYGPFGVLVKAAGQYAFDDLLTDEQFGPGGTDFGRGYNPWEITGDNGLGLTAELQYTRPMDLRFLNRIQLFTFCDFAEVWSRDEGIAAQSLTSAGGGVRAWLTTGLSLELTAADPLTLKSQRAGNTNDPQFLFQAVGLF
jgi:hemolysin activation/secretion protein